jgi:hypothetical protein
MSLTNIHLLEKEIRASFDVTRFSSGDFAGRITTFLSIFSSNSPHFTSIIREYNRKLSLFNLSSQIITPIDARFRPLDDSFFGTIIEPRKQFSQGSSSSDVQQIWNNLASTTSSVQFIKRSTTTPDGIQDNIQAPSSDRRIRIFSFNQPIGYGSGNFATDLNYPVRFRVSFTVTENSGHSVTQKLNSGQSVDRVNPITDAAVYFLYKDDDEIVNYPKYLNKNFFPVTAGFNAFEFEMFNDNDNSKPAMDIMIHAGAILDIDIEKIEVRQISD